MLHKFLAPGDWFAAQKYGRGSGFPTAWQGWVLIGAYVALIAGLSLLLERPSALNYFAWATGIILATVAFLLIARSRTPGRWN